MSAYFDGVQWDSKIKNPAFEGFFNYMVEARGVEPLSENLSARLSTSVVGVLTFPQPHPHQQGYGFSSLLSPPGPRHSQAGSPH